MILTIQNTVPEELHPFQRWAWRPITNQVRPGKDSPYDNKFGGVPYLLSNEEHPLCQNCKEPMQLFLQLQLGRIPDEIKKYFPGFGVLQLFYCTNAGVGCEMECKAWEPFAKSHLTRIIPIGHHSQPKAQKVRDALPVAEISRWKKLPDYPTYIEAKSLRLPINDMAWEDIANREVTQCLPEDKLWGWPTWTGNVSYPNCPTCQTPMRYLFQFASQLNLSYSFGEHGYGYIVQCKKHTEQLTFFWNC
jgi:hypothetical protein